MKANTIIMLSSMAVGALVLMPLMAALVLIMAALVLILAAAALVLMLMAAALLLLAQVGLVHMVEVEAEGALLLLTQMLHLIVLLYFMFMVDIMTATMTIPKSAGR